MVRTALFAVLLTLVVAGLGLTQIYPTVDFSFDPDNFIYTYTVTVTPDDDFAFGLLQVDAFVGNSELTPWILSGPFVNGVEQSWTRTWVPWDSKKDYDSAIWYTANHIDPDYLDSDWVAEFVFTAYNTTPHDDGAVLTMNGGIVSQNAIIISVPGPGGLIPEPSSMAALGTGLFGLAGMLIRRRKM